MDNKKQSSYREVFKSTSLFGGSQVLIIIISLVRSKIIALLLGTTGFGIASLYNMPLQLIATITSFGISFSAVRDISIAHEKGETKSLNKTYSVFRYLLFLTGIFGVIITVLISPLLSKWSFGVASFTLPFIILSITLLFTSLSNGILAYLRGIRHILASAKASVLGPLLGLVLSAPIYYLFGLKAIVPGIIITSIVSLFSSWFFFRTSKPNKISLSWKEIYTEGQEMIRLGVVMTVAGLLTQLVSYLIVAFISNRGGIEQVGLYNAGWSMTNQYVGIIFTAMAVDYFPRLSAINQDNKKVQNAVNEQGEITILLLTPILLLFIIFLPLLIKILFTQEFMGIVPYVRWMGLGMIFRAASWSISFVPGAKGDTKFFLMIEIFGSLIYYMLTVFGYSYLGLEGIGMAFVLNYIIYLLIVYIACHKKYNYTFNKEFITILIYSLTFLLITIYNITHNNFLILTILLQIISIAYSIRELNKRIDLIKILRKFKK